MLTMEVTKTVYEGGEVLGLRGVESLGVVGLGSWGIWGV